MDEVSIDLRVGSVLQERYRIIERLAVGSMGIVYRAERVLLGRPLAVKFLHASYAADPTFIQRFERETRVMGRLAHPHCVSVTDFGVDGGPYVVMEFVQGKTLRSLLEGGRLSVERAVLITRQTLAGLAHAHSLGIIHRDIKPANIMLMEATGTGDHVRILDFGLATLREAHSADISHSAIVIGTPNYMSPEQSIGGKADVRSDVYSTGVVLFELLTGRKPFTSEDTFELLSMHRSAPVPRLANVVPDAEFPPGLQDVLDRALAKSPDDRYQAAMDFQRALDQALEQPAPAPARQATRPVSVRDEEADYRRSLAVARSGPTRAARPRRRRGRFAVVAGMAALAVAGGGAWGGYTLWRGEVGARVRALFGGLTPEVESHGADLPGDRPGSVETEPAGATPAESPAATGFAPDEAREQKVAPGPASGGGDAAGKSGAGEGAPPAGGAGGASGAAAERPRAEPDHPSGGAGAAATGPGSKAEPSAGGAAGKSADDVVYDMPAEPALPPEEREEPVAPVAGDRAMVDSAEPDGDAAIKQSETASGVAPVEVDSIAGAVALIKAGRREDAIRALLALRRTAPKSAYAPYLLGHLYFEKGWWTVGMEFYDTAIHLNDLYAGKRILNENVIRALGNKKTRTKAARMVVNSIGRAALPFLARAAKSDPDVEVRDWCDWLIGRLGRLGRKNGQR
ncbi:MAG TPA: protein kinase [Candidatus Acidoferrum sp.]|nr:protein kinase [Candidatus Acidoferrum sp.]